MSITTKLSVAPRGYSFHGNKMMKNETGTITPTAINTEYEEVISENRYTVVQRGFWWRVKVGDGEAFFGKCHSKSAAEDVARLLRREFLNGAFAVRKREVQLGELGKLIADGALRRTEKNACQHDYVCKTDGNHGREEEWVCRRCGERQYR